MSTEDQAKHGYSIPAQLEACRNRAAEIGATEILEYVDEGVSGSILQRPGLSALREAVRNGGVDAVVCYDPDRLSRNLAHQLLLVEEFERAGVRLEFVNFEWKDTPDGRLFYALRGAIAEYEREKIRERMLIGKEQKAKRGLSPIGTYPYGYRLMPGGRLEVDEKEAEVVRLIFDWFVSEDIGVNGVAAKLTASGIPTRHGNPRWARATVRQILRNPAYIGVWYYGRRDCTGYAVGRKLPGAQKVRPKEKPREEWIPIPVPAIVEPEVWHRAQEKLREARRLWAGWSRREYLLSGIITCGDCGYSMHGAVREKGNGKRYRVYTCVRTTADEVGRGCRPIKNVNADAVEKVVWEQVVSWLNDPSALARELSQDGRRKELEAELARIDELLDGVRRGRANVRQALAAGLMDLDADTAATLKDLKAREERLLARRREVSAALGAARAAESRARDILKQAAQYLEELDSLDMEQKKALVRTLVKQVIVTGKGKQAKVTVVAAVSLAGEERATNSADPG